MILNITEGARRARDRFKSGLPNKMHDVRFALVNSFGVIYHDFMHVFKYGILMAI